MKRNWMKRIQCGLALLSIALMHVNSTHAIEVAGELFVDLDAANASGTVWSNAGSLGDFNAVASPTAVNLGGVVPSVIFDGSSAFLSADTAPAGITGLDSTKTIEAWVFNPALAGEETVVSWGHRGGPDGSNLSFNYGSNGAFGAVGHWGGPDLGWNNAGGGPAPLQWHHLAYTFDGTTTRVYSDGVLMNSEELGAGVINTHVGTQIAIASQFESDGVTLTPGLRGSMAISRVRVHDGVLSDAQIMSNYNEEIGSFPSIYEPPGEPVATPLSSGPIHRYSFSNASTADAAGATLVDSVGGADGVVVGPGTSFTGTSLKLSGGTSDSAGYGDLPNGLISPLTNVTIEGWAVIEGVQNWQRLFDFGSNEAGEFSDVGGSGNGADYLALAAARGGEINQQRLELRDVDSGVTTTVDSDIATTVPEGVHFAVTLEENVPVVPGLPEFGTATKLSHYRNGVLVAEGTTSIKLSDINDVNNWLGRSNWTGDSNLEGSFDEFRIYDRALSQGEIMGNIAAGPDSVNVVPEPNGAFALLAGLAGLSMLKRRRRK